MDLSRVIAASAHAVLGAAQRVDDAAGDLRTVRGRATVLVAGLRAASFVLGVAAVPLVVADLLSEEWHRAMDREFAPADFDETADPFGEKVDAGHP